MKKKTKNMIDENLSRIKIKGLNKDWFYDFFEVLSTCGYLGDFDKVSEIVFDEQSMHNIIPNSSFNQFMMASKEGKKSGKAFLDFLSNKFEKEGAEYAQQFLDEMFEFVSEHKTTETDFCNLCVKYTSLKCSEDIKVTHKNEEKFLKHHDEQDVYICASLGDFDIARAELTTLESLPGNIAFKDLRTTSFLTSQKLGQVVLQDVFRFTRDNFPSYELIGYGIKGSNVGAQRFYSRVGGTFYSMKSFEPVTMENMQKSKHSFFVLYDSADIEKFSTSETVKPLSYEEYIKLQNQRKEQLEHVN